MLNNFEIMKWVDKKFIIKIYYRFKLKEKKNLVRVMIENCCHT